MYIGMRRSWVYRNSTNQDLLISVYPYKPGRLLYTWHKAHTCTSQMSNKTGWLKLNCRLVRNQHLFQSCNSTIAMLLIRPQDQIIAILALSTGYYLCDLVHHVMQACSIAAPTDLHQPFYVSQYIGPPFFVALISQEMQDLQILNLVKQKHNMKENVVKGSFAFLSNFQKADDS